jgi:ribosomal protein L7/L12
MQSNYNAGFIQLVSFLSAKFGKTFTEADIAVLFTNVQNSFQTSVTPARSYGPVIDTARKMKEVVLKIQDHKKIEAIKLLREATGWGLKEAKDAVEGMALEMSNGVTQHLADLNSLVKINPRFNQLQRQTLDELISAYRSDRVF